MGQNFKRYCKDYENIENYQKALADNFKGWHCHHRLETHTSDGERRLVDITVAELKALDMYYNRPSSELIFLTESEHNAFNKGKYTGEKNPMYGKKHSVETINKMSEAHKNISEETRKKLSEAKKGKHISEEIKKKLSAASIGKHWYNNGKENKFCYKCPDGFVPGRLLIKQEE